MVICQVGDGHVVIDITIFLKLSSFLVNCAKVSHLSNHETTMDA